MNITICSGTGSGPNELLAFDTALLNAGIIDYNLIYLSSSIPAGSTIQRKTFHASPDEIGHKLYVVIAKQIEIIPGMAAWAGIGWTQEEKHGRGLFVEHHGNTRLQKISMIPAVTHIDQTARIQLVTKEANPRYYQLISEFKRQTGIPILLNTSFNIQEPIVCSPDDAIRTFKRSHIDCLVMGNFLVQKKIISFF
jgi:pyruvoyl-dependent arginine decarboxylase